MPPTRIRAPPSIERWTMSSTRRDLLLVDDRTELDVLAVRVAEAEALGLLGQRVDVRAGERLVDEVPPGREADLALELERREGAGRDGGVEVGVVEDDERVVAAELERDLLEPPARQLTHPPADGRRPGERHDRDVRVGDQRLADVGAADDDLEDALGQAGLAEDRLEHRAADDRRLRVRLQDDGVAERQRRRDDAHPQDRRRVPRGDRADDTDRDAPDHRQPALDDVGISEPYGCDGSVAALRISLVGEVRLVVHLAVRGAGLALVQVPNSSRFAS